MKSRIYSRESFRKVLKKLSKKISFILDCDLKILVDTAKFFTARGVTRSKESV